MRQERLSEVEREAAGSQPVKAGFFVAADGARRRRAGCAPVTEEKWEAEPSRQLSFHGGRPLAIGASSVSGPWQRGQLSAGRGSVVVTASVFSLPVVAAESSCLAFCSS